MTEEYNNDAIGVRDQRVGVHVPKFGIFNEPILGEDGKYLPPTPEQVAYMEERLDRLAELMANADFSWQLDGAINISLLEKRFIRNHKDIDIGVFDDELDKVEEYLSGRGFRFAKHVPGKDAADQRWIEFVSARDILVNGFDDIQLVQVDVSGSVVDEPLAFMDLHIQHRDTEGNAVIRYTGAKIPQEFMQSHERYMTQSGKEIPIAHPALVAYHKIETGRSYDLQDISYLKGQILDEDRVRVEEMIRGDYERTLIKFTPQFKEAFESLSPDMSDEKIRSSLMSCDAIARLQRDPDGQSYLAEFPQRYKARPGMTADEMVADLLQEVQAELKVRGKSEQKIQALHQALGV